MKSFEYLILLGNRSLRCPTSCVHAVVTPTLSSRRGSQLPKLFHARSLVLRLTLAY